MANIHVNGTGNANLRIGNNTKDTDLSVSRTAIARYIGARAVVDRVDEGVRITLTDYQGTTQEIVAEAIADITSNDDGSLTFTMIDGREITTDSLTGPQGETGADGFSPIATVSKSGKIATITITDKNGTTTAQVRDGEDGSGSEFSGDYDDLTNKPSINGVSLIGDKDTESLGIKDVFWATYGVTTNAEIDENYFAGRLVGVRHNNFVYVLAFRYSETLHEFNCMNQRHSRHIICENNAWTVDTSFFTSDYTELSNKPSIGGVPLSGSMSVSDLGIAEIFYAHYGTTTSAEIATAMSAEKLPCVRDASMVYMLVSYVYPTMFTFAATTPAGVVQYVTCENDNWRNGRLPLASAAALSDYVPTSDKGANNGVCPLDSNGKIAASYLPVYNGEVAP